MNDKRVLVGLSGGVDSSVCALLLQRQGYTVLGATLDLCDGAASGSIEDAKAVAEKLGVELWDVRFEKEGTEWYLRFFIDKDGLTIEDCENFSRAMDPILDEADPIEKRYVMEVSSPGIERKLNNDEQIRRYLGYLATVKFIRAPEGYNKREFLLQLNDVKDGVVTAEQEDGTIMTFPKSDTAYIKLYYDFDNDTMAENTAE